MNEPAVFDPSCFREKVMAITGAGQGIGRSVAELLASLGAAVLLMDRNAESLASVEAQLRERGGDVLSVAADVGRLEELEAAVEACRERWGAIHGWVNNAGINLHHTIEDQPDEEYLRVWQVNAHAAWRAAKLCLPLFGEAGGAIVNISSVMSCRTVPKSVAYTSSKGALEGLTRALAVELAPRRIRVNAVLPGYIPVAEALAKQPAGRPFRQPWPAHGRPIDVANTVAFLLSPAASFISGASIVVDGALLCAMTSP